MASAYPPFISASVSYTHLDVYKRQDNMWLINASGKEFNKSYSQLSKGGKKLIDEKKEELWHCFISYLKKDLMVETSIFIDSVSVILFSNSYSVSLIDFKQTYLFLVESLSLIHI
ncbi:hypothetical protein, partial [Enterococcus sp. 3H8_DIV0648]|uniref:hypothetical protein n=1 Tax=Enterococcus sp. 3H8_DIV0648 TaxID=1834178 RepID=UPI001C38DAAB